MLRVEDYILKLSEEKRQLYLVLMEIVEETIPTVTSRMAYGIPFYYLNKPFCYFHQHNDGVDLSFLNGNLMENNAHVLDRRDRKRVGTLHYQNIDDINIQILKDCLLEAAKIDQDRFKK